MITQLKRVLTIAGSDSGGSAGIQADLKTFEARGVFGTTAVTVVTAQDTYGVKAVHMMPEDFIRAQATAVLDDIGADALKTGLLGRETVVHLAAELVRAYNIQRVVVDPVLLDGRGRQFVSDEAVTAYREVLFPLVAVITPNLDEAALLAGIEIRTINDMHTAAQRLHEFGVKTVLVKGGHLADADSSVTHITDVIFDGNQFIELTALRLPVKNPHGVGCTFASAVAAELAKGQPAIAAITTAHHYLQAALAGILEFENRIGGGRTPVFHGVGRPPLDFES